MWNRGLATAKERQKSSHRNKLAPGGELVKMAIIEAKCRSNRYRAGTTGTLR
jgi:hypothetical protein